MPHPDFSGRWRFDPARSVLQIAAPDETVFVIEHREPALRIARTHRAGGRSDHVALELTTDGAPSEHESGGAHLVCRCSWEGDALLFHTRVHRAGQEGTNEVRYTLTDGGKTLRAEERFRSAALSYDNLWVLARRATEVG